jgi:hypothetical protein
METKPGDHVVVFTLGMNLSVGDQPQGAKWEGSKAHVMLLSRCLEAKAVEDFERNPAWSEALVARGPRRVATTARGLRLARQASNAPGRSRLARFPAISAFLCGTLRSDDLTLDQIDGWRRLS